MQKRRILAALLAGTFVFSMTGCKKIESVTSEEFENAWENTDADEMSFDELGELSEEDFEAQLYDGFYYTFEPDDIEYFPMIIPTLKSANLDLNLDSDDIEQVSVGARVFLDPEDADLFDMESLNDLSFSSVAGIQITLNDSVDLDELEDGIDDLLDNIDINIEDLSSSEYRRTKNGLSLALRVSISDLRDSILESDFIDLLHDSDIDEADDFEDMIENLEEGDIVLYIVASDENILILGGASLNYPVDFLIDFTDEFGLTDPYNLESNRDITNAIVDVYVERIGAYSSFTSYRYYGF